MALDTYSDLVNEIDDWMDRSMSARVPSFIRMLEARLNRVLRVPDMETSTTISASAETATLPTGFRSMKALWIDGNADDQLESMSLANLKMMYGGQAGTPKAYAIAGGLLYVGPVPSSAETLQSIYFTEIPALTESNTSNWLLADHPDIYVYGCLVMAEARGWNDPRLPILKGALDEALQELTQAAGAYRFGSAPLVARMNMPTIRGVAV